MKYVTTPNGQMRVSGLSRIWAAFLIDILIGVLSLALISAVTGLFQTYGGITGAFLAPIAYAYALMAYWGRAPSLGRWALALRRYKHEEIEEYTGEGTLFVVATLPGWIAALRFACAVILLFGLYGLIQLV